MFKHTQHTRFRCSCVIHVVHFTDFFNIAETWEGRFSDITGGFGNCPNPYGHLPHPIPSPNVAAVLRPSLGGELRCQTIGSDHPSRAKSRPSDVTGSFTPPTIALYRNISATCYHICAPRAFTETHTSTNVPRTTLRISRQDCS